MEDVQVDQQFHFTWRGLVLSAVFTNHTPSMDQTIIAHVSHANMQVLLLECALMLRL